MISTQQCTTGVSAVLGYVLIPTCRYACVLPIQKHVLTLLATDK